MGVVINYVAKACINVAFFSFKIKDPLNKRVLRVGEGI
jgi:hypothetical protein